MSNSASITLQDYDRERGVVSFNPGPLTSVNYDAKRAALAALQTAIEGLTLGEVRQTTFSIQTGESVVAVTNKNAQRETKWIVVYRDDTEYLDVANTIENTGFQKLFTVELPTADLSLLPSNPASDALDLTAVPVAAFITAFEAFQNSPTGGNNITVIEIRHVGRAS